jgi:hypothetical protein
MRTQEGKPRVPPPRAAGACGSHERRMSSCWSGAVPQCDRGVERRCRRLVRAKTASGGVVPGGLRIADRKPTVAVESHSCAAAFITLELRYDLRVMRDGERALAILDLCEHDSASRSSAFMQNRVPHNGGGDSGAEDQRRHCKTQTDVAPPARRLAHARGGGTSRRCLAACVTGAEDVMRLVVALPEERDRVLVAITLQPARAQNGIGKGDAAPSHPRAWRAPRARARTPSRAAPAPYHRAAPARRPTARAARRATSRDRHSDGPRRRLSSAPAFGNPRTLRTVVRFPGQRCALVNLIS